MKQFLILVILLTNTLQAMDKEAGDQLPLIPKKEKKLTKKHLFTTSLIGALALTSGISSYISVRALDSIDIQTYNNTAYPYKWDNGTLIPPHVCRRPDCTYELCKEVDCIKNFTHGHCPFFLKEGYRCMIERCEIYNPYKKTAHCIGSIQCISVLTSCFATLGSIALIISYFA